MLIRGKQSGLKWLGVTEWLNVGVESADSYFGALRVLIYRVLVLSDKCRLSLPSSTALHVRAFGSVDKRNRHTDGQTGNIDRHLSFTIMVVQCVTGSDMNCGV